MNLNIHLFYCYGPHHSCVLGFGNSTGTYQYVIIELVAQLYDIPGSYGDTGRYYVSVQYANENENDTKHTPATHRGVAAPQRYSIPVFIFECVAERQRK